MKITQMTDKLMSTVSVCRPRFGALYYIPLPLLSESDARQIGLRSTFWWRLFLQWSIVWFVCWRAFAVATILPGP